MALNFVSSSRQDKKEERLLTLLLECESESKSGVSGARSRSDWCLTSPDAALYTLPSLDERTSWEARHPVQTEFSVKVIKKVHPCQMVR